MTESHAGRNRLLDYTARAQEDARALAGSLGSVAHEVEGHLSTQARARPYLTLGAAAAAGFALGGGLPRRWGRFVAGLALRTAASVAVSALAARITAGALDPGDPAPADTGGGAT
ncbi:MAG: hypothetical protein AB7N76_09905 [Planctomycetota bacterium]